jgi:hypothetical protein
MNLEIKKVKLLKGNHPLIQFVFNKDGKQITRHFTVDNFIYMIDYYDKNHIAVDAKTGEVFKDYLLSLE